MRWGKMRTIKVSPEKFANAVKQKAERCKFVSIPSSNRKFVYAGLLMAGGCWVAWPDNLTQEEMSEYINVYGNIPDLFTPKTDQQIVNFAPKGDEIERQED